MTWNILLNFKKPQHLLNINLEKFILIPLNCIVSYCCNKMSGEILELHILCKTSIICNKFNYYVYAVIHRYTPYVIRQNPCMHLHCIILMAQNLSEKTITNLNENMNSKNLYCLFLPKSFQNIKLESFFNLHLVYHYGLLELNPLTP